MPTPPLTWNDSLSVGLADIDEQHRQLIAQVNHLTEAMNQGRGRAEIEKTLEFLSQYAVKHFAAEERYFDQYRCPAAQANRLAHARFVTQFQALRDRAQKEGPTASLVLEVKRDLADWLVNHIQTIDCQLRSYVPSAGKR